MSGGYAGKIARINLSNRSISTINTSDYETWVGGHGMGSAIFYDIMVKEKRAGFGTNRRIQSGMRSDLDELSGVGNHCAGGPRQDVRCRGSAFNPHPLDGLRGVNFGGRFSTHMKYAGWDGMVIEGKATMPVWLDIRDQEHTNPKL